MFYEVSYKKPGAMFWKRIKNVEGDLLLADDRPDGSNQPLPVRVLILADKTRIELPMNGVIIKFSPQRFYDSVKRAESETGVSLKV
jgi:hypothetical protein